MLLRCLCTQAGSFKNTAGDKGRTLRFLHISLHCRLIKCSRKMCEVWGRCSSFKACDQSKFNLKGWLRLRTHYTNWTMQMPDISLNYRLVWCMHGAYLTNASLCRPDWCAHDGVTIFEYWSQRIKGEGCPTMCGLRSAGQFRSPPCTSTCSQQVSGVLCILFESRLFLV